MRGLGAWMLGCSDGSYDVYRITRLPHVLQVAQASRYWMTDPERGSLLRCKQGRAPLGLHSRSKGNEVWTQAMRDGCPYAAKRSPTSEVDDGAGVWWSLGHWSISHVMVSDWQLTLLDAHWAHSMQAQVSGMDTVQLAPAASYCSCGSPQRTGQGLQDWIYPPRYERVARC